MCGTWYLGSPPGWQGIAGQGRVFAGEGGLGLQVVPHGVWRWRSLLRWQKPVAWEAAPCRTGPAGSESSGMSPGIGGFIHADWPSKTRWRLPSSSAVQFLQAACPAFEVRPPVGTVSGSTAPAGKNSVLTDRFAKRRLNYKYPRIQCLNGTSVAWV